MKQQEIVSCAIKPAYLEERDPEFISHFGVDLDKELLLELHLKYLMRVDDFYKDGTTFYKTL